MGGGLGGRKTLPIGTFSEFDLRNTAGAKTIPGRGKGRRRMGMVDYTFFVSLFLRVTKIANHNPNGVIKSDQDRQSGGLGEHRTKDGGGRPRRSATKNLRRKMEIEGTGEIDQNTKIGGSGRKKQKDASLKAQRMAVNDKGRKEKQDKWRRSQKRRLREGKERRKRVEGYRGYVGKKRGGMDGRRRKSVDGSRQESRKGKATAKSTSSKIKRGEKKNAKKYKKETCVSKGTPFQR